MTAESTAVCDQQTAEGRRSRGAQRLGRATDRQPLPPGSWWTTMRSSRRPARTLPAAPSMRPQIPGLSPGGLGPHLTSSGSPAGFPPVSRLPAGLFPFARRPLVSHRPAFSGSLPSAVAQVPVPPSVSPRVPFPLSNLHVSAAARRFCRRWSLAAGTKVTSSAATTSPGSRSARTTDGSDWARWDAATESPDMRRGAGYAFPPRASCRTAELRALSGAAWAVSGQAGTAAHGGPASKPGASALAGRGMLSRFQSRRRTCSDRPGTVMRSPGLTTVRSWAAITGTAVSRTFVHSTP
jgi:hypothetical protein